MILITAGPLVLGCFHKVPTLCGDQTGASGRHLNHARAVQQSWRRRSGGGLTQSPVSAAGFAFALRVRRRPQREANFRPLSVQCPVGASGSRGARGSTTKRHHASHAGQPALPPLGPKSHPARTRPSIRLRVLALLVSLLIQRAVPRRGAAWKHGHLPSCSRLVGPTTIIIPSTRHTGTGGERERETGTSGLW